jgi:hypothetical protein
MIYIISLAGIALVLFLVIMISSKKAPTADAAAEEDRWWQGMK